MDKGKNELVEDYTTWVVQFKKNLHGTEKEIMQPEFIRKFRQDVGEILAPIDLAINDPFKIRLSEGMMYSCSN